MNLAKIGGQIPFNTTYSTDLFLDLMRVVSPFTQLLFVSYLTLALFDFCITHGVQFLLFSLPNCHDCMRWHTQFMQLVTPHELQLQQ